MTLGGAMVSNPEPGGRGQLSMIFPAFWKGAQVNRDASWTISRLLNGSVMRIRLCRSAQIVSAGDLGISTNGNPWANGETWANGENWESTPAASIVTTSLAGTERFYVDLSVVGQVLWSGHVIGFHLDGYDFAHMVMEITYGAGNIAEVTVSPPLRRDVGPSDAMLFRPSMIVTCQNAAEVAADSPSRKFVSLGAASFAEFLV